MKLLVVSDVHANRSALRRLESKSAHAVIFLGDAVTYGTRPAECLEWLGCHALWAVLGNHDEALLRATDGFRATLVLLGHTHRGVLLKSGRLSLMRCTDELRRERAGVLPSTPASACGGRA